MLYSIYLKQSKYLLLSSLEAIATLDITEVKEMNAAVAAVLFALETDDGMSFLRLWNEGEFDVIRKEWPDAPIAVFTGADPMLGEMTEDMLFKIVEPTDEYRIEMSGKGVRGL